ncbi:unnamed protein product [Parascedosporium putredinis]|uniref:Dolichyl-phosphate-mannose--protein mannosyltransferase n=1 Tax=Parascedosporium putredinis TaxID=1442378 RepID=A0A9P1H968_9PEZI|nr:unnamed protein product [Parascedosporium putredinis]CAI8001404.1 unnamed protein product [Parascedosporium putredinis]
MCTQAPQSKSKKGGKASQSYASEGVEDYDVFLLPVSDYQIVFGITILAAVVRMFRIYQPTSVVFDEVHFGGFATKYIKGKFFMDVHPPLAKMLIALTGWLAGFKGDFDFKEIGKDYLEPGVPYVAMRMFPAICGTLLAPTMFLTLKATGCRTMTAVLGALFIIFENGLLTQARLILLDSPLVLATGFAAMAFSSFCNQHEQGPSKAFQLSWWFWLAMSGLGLGITVSIKWTGLFTIAWVGSLTLLQLWLLLGDTKTVTVRLWFKHLFARALCLIVIPLAFYMAMFAIHFQILRNPGDGDGFMSSEFQSTLNSKGMHDVAADVYFGSRVTLRHVNTQGGYLHSHPSCIPRNGAVLRLYHTNTHRRLHSHDVRPPVTEADWQNEVSAYGYEGFEGDANDYFRVEIVKSKSTGALAKERVRAVQTKFKLVHVMTGCVLFSHKVKLPEWASEQQEVTCARGGTLPNSLWPGFLGKFIELHKVMWRTNAGLTDSHAWDSRPESWPILRRGINFWGRNHRQVYLMGNPVVWYTSTLAIVVYVLFKGFAVLRWQRSCGDYEHVLFKRFDYEIGSSVLGWAFHYFPFFLMKRQLFLHHYFPALFFGILAFCQTFDFVTARAIVGASRPGANNAAFNKGAAVFFLVLSAIAFGLFSPLAYGNTWTKSECKRVKLFTTWDFDCNTFLEDYDGYKNLPSTSASSAQQTSAKGGKSKGKGKKKAVAPVVPAEEIADAAEAAISGAPPVVAGQKVLDQEEHVEYRDQDGNLLDIEQVKALEGKVEFKTRYETRTRLVDEAGNEVVIGENGEPIVDAVAPPHPDDVPSKDGEAEAKASSAKPASEGGNEATGQEKAVAQEDEPVVDEASAAAEPVPAEQDKVADKPAA